MKLKLQVNIPARHRKDDGESPIVVRTGDQADEDYAARARAELAPVTDLMDWLDLPGAGFTVAPPGAADIKTAADVDNADIDRGSLEKLMLAREEIRSAAREDGALWTLPNALLYYEGLVVELFGDRGPGTPRDASSYSTVRLVPLAPERKSR